MYVLVAPILQNLGVEDCHLGTGQRLVALACMCKFGLPLIRRAIALSGRRSRRLFLGVISKSETVPLEVTSSGGGGSSSGGGGSKGGGRSGGSRGGGSLIGERTPIAASINKSDAVRMLAFGNCAVRCGAVFVVSFSYGEVHGLKSSTVRCDAMRFGNSRQKLHRAVRRR